ncbi:MAG TPA: methyltransferase domain-containing protein [Allocoleopsis sp.]
MNNVDSQRIKKMVLKPEQRAKLDPSDDNLFYDYPRFVTHVDDMFMQQLTDLYSARLKPNTKILDLMSSWVSHLPNIQFSHVEGHGMNEEELRKNPRLNHYFIQNLNQNPKLPFLDQEFDAVINCVSVQYLQYPEAIFSEIYRILKPGGIVIISFSNRMFFEKAIALWRDNTEEGRIELVKNYFTSVKGFTQPEVISKVNPAYKILQSLGFPGSDPFYAVISSRS